MRALRMALAVAVAVFLGVPAFGQFGPGGGMRGGAGMLIGNKGVQKELKLSDDQIKKIGEHNKTLEPKRQEAREAFQSGDQEKAREIQKEIATETEKLLKETLKPDQQKRLKQIQRQTMGPGAFTDEETAKELKLTDEQKDEIKKVN